MYKEFDKNRSKLGGLDQPHSAAIASRQDSNSPSYESGETPRLSFL